MNHLPPPPPDYVCEWRECHYQNGRISGCGPITSGPVEILIQLLGDRIGLPNIAIAHKCELKTQK